MYDKLVTKSNAIDVVDVNKLVSKADYRTKIVEIKTKIPVHEKYITTPEFNMLTKEDFEERLKQAKFNKQK